MDNNQIIKYNNGQLVKAGNYIAITEKILSLGEIHDAIFYFKRAEQKCELANFLGALEDYTKAIEINPKYAMPYNNRGLSKIELNDYLGAIEDFNKAIENLPNFSNAYRYRGFVKNELKDYLGAIEDFNKSIEIKEQNGYAYHNRGISKHRLADKSFCDDWKKAEALGYKPSSDMIRRYCEF